MWPLTGSEVVAACQGSCAYPTLDDLEIVGTCTDSRQVQNNQLFVAILGEKHDGHNFVAKVLESTPHALALVAESWEGLNALPSHHMQRCIVVSDVTASLRLLARRLRERFSFPVIGIGGSNGKTTTKEMLFALLSGSYRVTKTAKSENGFLGLAMTLSHATHSLSYSPHALVLEIGIDETGAMDEHCRVGSPDWALLTALGPEHLAGLGNWENAIEEEYRLFDFSPRTRRIWQAAEPVLRQRLSAVRSGDTVVIPHSDLDSSAPLRIPGNSDADIRIRGISVLTFHCEVADDIVTDVELRWYPASSQCNPNPVWHHSIRVPLPGLHNASNFALAAGAALSLGRTPREICNAWKNFQPPAMRSRISTLANGCLLYDDCYNASPESMKAALSVLKRVDWVEKPKIVFLGDMLDLGDESRKWHLELLDSLRDLRDVHLCFFGNAMYDVFQELKKNESDFSQRRWKISHIPPSESPKKFFEEIQTPFSSAVVLVKGSRGMDLGRVVSAVEELCR